MADVAESVGRRYRGEAYWERERPKEADAGRVRLRYFEQAGKLQVVQLWRDDAGQVRPGKTVTLDVESLSAHEGSRGLLAEFLRAAEALGRGR